jgi:UDP-N-acetylglucosamine:LPS N-acetylglucosamine transferase
VLASADLVMTKPGYGTIVEAVVLGLPVIYVRRYNFADEGPLIDFLLRHGSGQELSREDFFSGNWQPALDALTERRPERVRPSVTGAIDAARFLIQYFQ